MTNGGKYILLTCYHCGNKTLMENVANHEFDDPFCQDRRQWHLYECPICNEVTLFRISDHDQDEGKWRWEDRIVYPYITRSRGNMPKNVHDAFKAAMKVRHIDGAICALSLRRTLEMMCKDLGETKGNLYAKLKNLSDRGVLPPILGDMAQILKDLGNAAAHADDVEFPKEIVEAMIHFTQTILDYVYNLPESLADIQRKMLKRNPRPTSSKADEFETD